MVTIGICEDSLPVQAQIENYISEILDNCPLEVFSNGEELLDYLSDRKQRFSLYFMDISLPGISGIETAAAIREKDPYALIIYITDYKEYVYQVFETLPYRFITKPVKKEVFQKALTDAINYLTDRGELFCFHIDRDQYQIPFQEIVYFESRLRRLMLHTVNETYSFYGKLNEITKSLNPLLFVRTHVSYLVNMEYIHSMESKTHYGKEKETQKKLSEYLKRGRAVARPLAATIKRVNEMVRGWINYFRIGADERVYEEVWGMAAAQDKSNRHETVEEAENHLQESELLKLEES